MRNKSKTITWLLRIIAAVIMLQTLYFKFSAHPEAVYIFSRLNMEPWGRIGIGIGELIASVLILIPRTTWIGATIGIALMAGAIYFHLTTLGIDVYNDGGKLFGMALIVLVCCTILLWINRRDVPVLSRIA